MVTDAGLLLGVVVAVEIEQPVMVSVWDTGVELVRLVAVAATKTPDGKIVSSNAQMVFTDPLLVGDSLSVTASEEPCTWHFKDGLLRVTVGEGKGT